MTENERPVRAHLELDTVRHLLWFFGDRNLGQQPGHFVERLLNTISAADPTNRDKLANEYPQHVAGFNAVQQTPWGLDWLRGIAKAELDNQEQGLDFEAVL